MSSEKSIGIVYLVGAGPGDPGLITVRGRTLLEQADVVVYDYLANPKLLDYCPNAQTLYVGKKAAAHTLSQDGINQLLIDQARLGKRVVRLKGGDPFVFGRGGEECEALHAAGITFQVVPGITSAIGASAYAGIPVTHRDFNSSFTVITGHEKEDESSSASSNVDWAVIAKLPCVAFYMGAKSLPQISQKLIEHGMNPATPAATIQWGTTPRQRSVSGTIADLPQIVEQAGITAPAITIIGNVVSLRPIMNWFETRPLFGQTIVVTRTRQQASELSQRLEELGANVIEAPTIELNEPADWAPVDHALGGGGYDWIIFTSPNGVRYTRQRLGKLGRDVRVFDKAKIAAVGDATADAIASQLALHVDLCPESFVAEALADALETRGEIRENKFLLLRADIARPILRQRLEQAGAALVDDVALYETQPARSLPQALLDALAGGSVNWVTFTSASTVNNFAALIGGDFAAKLAGVKLASIGPITTQAMTQLGLKPAVEARTSNIDGLVAAIVGR